MTRITIIASGILYLHIFPCTFQFFNNALMLGKTSESYLSDHLYDLIYELNAIAPSVLLAVLPQLEFKLKVRILFCNAFKKFQAIIFFINFYCSFRTAQHSLILLNIIVCMSWHRSIQLFRCQFFT